MSVQRDRDSEVVRLLRQIEAEYESGVHGLSGLAYGSVKHEFITARMERMGQLHEELQELVGENQAITLLVSTLESDSESINSAR